MPSIPLVALKGFAYHRKRLTKGDAFEALTASDAHVLTATGLARTPGPEPLSITAAVRGYEPEPAALQPDDPHAIPSPKRRRPKKYETADLTPDDK